MLVKIDLAPRHRLPVERIVNHTLCAIEKLTPAFLVSMVPHDDSINDCFDVVATARLPNEPCHQMARTMQLPSDLRTDKAPAAAFPEPGASG